MGLHVSEPGKLAVFVSDDKGQTVFIVKNLSDHGGMPNHHTFGFALKPDLTDLTGMKVEVVDCKEEGWQKKSTLPSEIVNVIEHLDVWLHDTPAEEVRYTADFDPTQGRAVGSCYLTVVANMPKEHLWDCIYWSLTTIAPPVRYTR